MSLSLCTTTHAYNADSLWVNNRIWSFINPEWNTHDERRIYRSMSSVHYWCWMSNRTPMITMRCLSSTAKQDIDERIRYLWGTIDWFSKIRQSRKKKMAVMDDKDLYPGFSRHWISFWKRFRHKRVGELLCWFSSCSGTCLMWAAGRLLIWAFRATQAWYQKCRLKGLEDNYRYLQMLEPLSQFR
jgi:hypothetical protein